MIGLARHCGSRISLSLAAALLFGAATLVTAPAAQARDDQEPSGGQKFSAQDHDIRKDSTSARAVHAALKGDFSLAFEKAKASHDPIAQKTVEWLYLRREPKQAGYERLMSFVAQNPQWPARTALLVQAEELLHDHPPSADTIIAHFKRHAPESRDGYIVLARALLAKGDKAGARKNALAAWYDTDLTTEQKDEILRHLGSVVGTDDYKHRLWLLIHAQETNAAIRTAELISKTHVAAAKAAQMLIRRQSAGVKAYKKLPKSFQQTAALQYALARYYRKVDNYDAARDLLLRGPRSADAMIDPEAWWIERRLIVRYSLGPENRKHWRDAYKLATMHGFKEGTEFEEGEFLAGWLALRNLNDPKTALKHFSRIGPRATSRTEQARGEYWTARAYLALGDQSNADKHFRIAASTPTVYYGQLAREALGMGRTPIDVASPTPSDAQRAQVESYELVRAFRLIDAAGGDSQLGQFIWPLAATARSSAEASAIARIIYEEAGAYYTVRFAKASGRYGRDIDDWGYPVSAMPKIRQLGNPVEAALVYGLTRQESEFNAGAASHAGARGLMQIMPSTGKLLARHFHQRHSTDRLTADPAYNVALGTAYLGKMLADFDGSYVMTIAGYNAGPGRSRDWAGRFGDPRTGAVDPIDWVESIPFTETRRYVQKVLQNIHVYRSRLAPKSAIGMSADLRRSSRTRIQPAGDTTCGKKTNTIAGLVGGC